ncbi:S9 family peptidase [Phenylobacterium sp. LH3H17]|uniref:S9 family peptidase n=1 Tax=Phenylobacterium sp. LH3H17 TaxID=2903901 RepID=UPI0020CA22F0|nr:S9 family peptidase [Phenylobacterium sp. LH3H17]UTP39400.1 S9 family peptidase [Phenylobacterium sp. LH3H17]
MRKLLVAAAALTLGMGAMTAQAAPSVSAPLIERTKFFGNPSRSQGRISPDGKWLAWIAPRDGVQNIWVAPIADPAKAKPLTDEKTRPIRSYFWAPNASQILFVNDKGGDENFLLYGVEVASGVQTTLTPFEKTRVQVLGISREVKDRILVGLNNRDPRWHDVHSLDLATGKLSLVLQGDGFGGFDIDEQLQVRTAYRPRPDGGYDLYAVENGKVAPAVAETVGFEDTGSFQGVGFTVDGATRYWVDPRNRDTAVLVAQDVKSGARTVLGESSKADIGSAMINPRTGKVEAYAVNYLTTEWKVVDPAVKGDLEFLEKNLEGEIAVTSRTDADDLWTVAVDPVTAPSALYLYDRKARALSKLYVTRPELEGATLAAMHPVEIKSRDGLVQASYLTLPPGWDSNGDGKPDKPLPMVLLVHGGPWGRDVYGYNGQHQWLANRGYAVLSANFRASTGFGKAFVNAGNLEWGARMHDDLLDAVDWAVKNGVTTKDQVAIMGGSYGGYATLAGLAFTPDVFACGVDIVGPSNLNTLLSTVPAYWEAGRKQMYRRMGDPGTPEGAALLKERSPLTKADRIKKPLLIGQGANDPRVNQAESDQIVKALQAKNIPVTYALFPDEGHGFARPENNIAFYATAEHFLGRCLGGRAEPFGAALVKTSMTVPHGAEFAPGLEAALKAKVQ